ncbi:amidohydrolase family protein [Mycoplasmopsis cynos]|uniref:amidohydrolase family protein n=2 Tax=Mycoplasmopsis cynos TaxID=171284 RepID=UPI0024C706F7|nr:amidohydrolase family protein [Mycoplasmopsis cynos]WAM03281.1 amidohydrolase family protein [Mycoplasmopsis cynos]
MRTFYWSRKKGAHKPEYLTKANKTKINAILKASNYNLKKISFDPTMMPLNSFKYLQNDLKIIGSISILMLIINFVKNFSIMVAIWFRHLWNAMSGVDSRHPGLAQAALYNDQVYTELIIDFVHSTKETILFTIKNKTPDKIIAISDAIKPAYYHDGENISGGIKVEKHGKLITLAGTNTIAGSGIMIYDAFLNLIKIGCSLNDAVKMTSYNAAKHLGYDKLGEIKKDYLADIVILNSNDYKIKSVYIDGRKIK